jgi:cytoskeletal protein CcmA (bactofilin family)
MLGRTKTQTAYREPQPAYREPQPVFREPQPAYRDPQPAYVEPQPVFREPQPAYREPAVTMAAAEPAVEDRAEAPPAPVFAAPTPAVTAPRVPPGPPPLFKMVGTGASLDGRFEVAESIDIECRLSGELIVEGRLLIGPHGIVNATAHTVDAVIEGCYEGTMVATGTVEILPTGRVNGNLETDSLVIAKGAVFNGNVSRRALPEPPPRARSHR